MIVLPCNRATPKVINDFIEKGGSGQFTPSERKYSPREMSASRRPGAKPRSLRASAQGQRYRPRWCAPRSAALTLSLSQCPQLDAHSVAGVPVDVQNMVW